MARNQKVIVKGRVSVDKGRAGWVAAHNGRHMCRRPPKKKQCWKSAKPKKKTCAARRTLLQWYLENE